MPSDRLSEIAEREAAATPGEWKFCAGYPCEIWHTLPVVRQITAGGGGTVFRRDPRDASQVHEMASSTWTVENAAFIAHARADIPWLLQNTTNALAYIERIRTPEASAAVKMFLGRMKDILQGLDDGRPANETEDKTDG